MPLNKTLCIYLYPTEFIVCHCDFLEKLAKIQVSLVIYFEYYQHFSKFQNGGHKMAAVECKKFLLRLPRGTKQYFFR